MPSLNEYLWVFTSQLDSDIAEDIMSYVHPPSFPGDAPKPNLAGTKQTLASKRSLNDLRRRVSRQNNRSVYLNAHFIFSIFLISRALIGFFRAALAALIVDNFAESMSLLLVCIASAGIHIEFGWQRLVGLILEETVV